MASSAVGRARMLEIVLGAGDFDADTAERYGWINRAVADAEFENFVDAFAKRVANFDRAVLAGAKKLINKKTGLPSADEIRESGLLFRDFVGRPETQRRIGRLLAEGLEAEGDAELKLGDLIAKVPLE